MPVAGGDQSYTLESTNDPYFATFPPPQPVHRLVHEFDITSSTYERMIEVRSRRHRNLSITLENRGSGLIRGPHLFGPHGWDFRSLEEIGEAVTDSAGLTREEKFIRLHEWKGLHVTHVTGTSYLPYVDRDFSSNPLRVLNQYGHAMCGQSTVVLNSLIRAAPPVGSMFGRSVKLGTHRVGEAYWGGAWHAYDATPGTGVVQWVYYESDNRTIAPTWKYLIDDPSLVSRIVSYTNATSIPHYIEGATGETFAENRAMPEWDFDFDLRPRESLTMYFDMRGRLDQTSMRQGSTQAYRGYSDYGSAVFQYKPDMTTTTYRTYSPRESNVRVTSGGLVPVDPTKPSYVVLDMRSAWCFVGATIKASFKTSGKVYVAVKEDPYDTEYSSSLPWQLLSSSQKEYTGSSIEGKMAFWVKLEFQGTGSGLSAVDVAAEVQMSQWSMPGLEYGWNRILFEADDMGGSRLRVTYRYDDLSPYHLYEPATSNYGRHIPVRIGGLLHKGSSLTRVDYGKARFWDRIHAMAGEEADVLLEIVQVFGDRAGRKVRTLVDESLPWGWYKFYWNGRDDAGRTLPRGMYAYKLCLDGKLVHGERLYLFETIWPEPNEIARSGPEEKGLGPSGPEKGRHDEADVLGPGNASAGEDDDVAILDTPGADRIDARALGDDANGGGGGGEAEPSIALASGDALSEPGFEGTVLDPGVGLDGRGSLPLLVKSLVGVASNDVPRKPGSRPDRAQIVGVLPGLPRGWDPAGKQVRIDIGGAQSLVTLDRRGRGLGGSATLKLKLARTGGVFAGGDVPFTLRLAGDLAPEWLDEGMDPWEDESGILVPFGTRIDIDGRVYEATVDARLTSSAGQSGRLVYPAGR